MSARKVQTNEEIMAGLRQLVQGNKDKWAARAPEVREAAHKARLSNGTWRQMSGIKLFLHEMSYVGNRPFAIGFGFCVTMGVIAQCRFSDEMKVNSEYWSTFHAAKKDHH